MLLWNVSIDGYLGALIAQLTAEIQPLAQPNVHDTIGRYPA